VTLPFCPFSGSGRLFGSQDSFQSRPDWCPLSGKGKPPPPLVVFLKRFLLLFRRGWTRTGSVLQQGSLCAGTPASPVRYCTVFFFYIFRDPGPPRGGRSLPPSAGAFFSCARCFTFEAQVQADPATLPVVRLVAAVVGRVRRSFWLNIPSLF